MNDPEAAFLAGEPIDLDGESLDASVVEAMCKNAWRAGSHRNLIVRNGTIDGDLVFDYVQTDASIELRSVTLSGSLRLRRTALNRLILSDCRVRRIEAAGLETARGVDLNGKFESQERVRLVGAVIQGNLEAKGARFGRSADDCRQDRSALVLDAARIEGNVNLRNVTASGRIRAWRAQIGGTLTCSGTTDELVVRSARVDANANLAECDVAGAVDLRNSTFGGWVSVNRTKVAGDLLLQRCSVGENLILGTLTVGGHDTESVGCGCYRGTQGHRGQARRAGCCHPPARLERRPARGRDGLLAGARGRHD